MCDFLIPEPSRRQIKADKQRTAIETFCGNNGVVCKEVFDCTPPADRTEIETKVLTALQEATALVVCGNYGEVFGLSGFFTFDDYQIGSPRRQLFLRFIKPLWDAGKDIVFVDEKGNFIRSMRQTENSTLPNV
jgi:hypothetical protein